MKSVPTKILTVAIILSFVIPNTLFFYPQKAEAQAGAVASCVAGYAAAAVAALSSAPQNIIGVPKSQVGDTVQNTVTSGSTNALSFNNCILKPLAQQMLIGIIRNIGASVVDWVNSGFEGKPLFVTDFEGLLLDTADQTIGGFIEGSELGWLCNNFSFQIRIALATKYSQPSRDKYRCTVSDIVDNTQNFIDNNGGRGWDNWLNLTTNSQNNVYGAYFTAKSDLAQRVVQKEFDKINEVTRNSGFLDFKTCDEYESAAETQSRIDGATASREEYGNEYVNDADFSQKAKCKTMSAKTPGTIIASKLGSTVNMNDTQLAVAQEIDQVIAAVLNQLAQKAISGANGLLGLSKKKSSSNGSSYLAKYQQQYYGINQTTSANLSGATSELDDYRIVSYDAAGNLILNDPNAQGILNTSNNAAQQASDAQTQQQIAISNNNGVNISEKNVSLSKPSTQSSVGAGSASNAVNGVKEGNVTQYTAPSITGEEQNPWWQTDLGTPTEIKEIRIWRVTNKPVSQTLENIRVVVSNTNGQIAWQSNPITPNESSPNPLVVSLPNGISGQVVRVQKTGTLDTQCRIIFQFANETDYESCYQPLELVEVEVIQPISIAPAVISGTGTGSTSGNTPVSADNTPKLNTSILNNAIYAQYGLDYTASISTEGTATNLKIISTLLKNGSPVPFLSVFYPFQLSWGVQGGTVARQNITSQTDASAAWTGVNITPSSTFQIGLNGVRSGAQTGSYSIQTRVEDNSGVEIQTQTTNFVVQ